MITDIHQPVLDYLTLKLTNRCNMRCYTCGQVYSGTRQDQQDLPLETLRTRLSDVDTVKTVYLFGGEPLLYGDFVPLLELLSAKHMTVLLTTNGLLLHHHADAIIDNNVRDLTVSIDSYDAAVYRDIRGTDSLAQVMDNLGLLIAQRSKRGATHPYIGANTLITPNNYKDLVRIYQHLTHRYPEIDRINFETPIMTTLELGADYEAVFEQRFGCRAESWKWFYNRIPPFAGDILETVYSQIQVLKELPKVTFQAPTTRQGVNDALTLSYSIPNRSCHYPFSVLAILPNGDATFCVDFPDYIIGNIADSSLADLWQSDKARAMRESLMKDGLFPICARCPHRFDEDDFLIQPGTPMTDAAAETSAEPKLLQ